MKYLICLIFIQLFVMSFAAQEPARDPQAEEPFYQELRKIDPSLVEKFAAATAALDTGNFAAAEQGYSEILEKVPDFEAALRRRGYALTSLGRREEGLELTGRALELNRSVDNLVGHASNLVRTDDPRSAPSPADLREVENLSREAWGKSEFTEESAAVLLAESLLMSEKLESFESHAEDFHRKMPDSPAAAYYNALAMANRGDFSAAEAELNMLKEKGVPAESIDPLLVAISAARDESYFGLGRFFKYGYIISGILALWALGLAVLFILGAWLSSKTLVSIENSDPNDISGKAQAGLKGMYRKVISIAGLYYYLSQPVVIFLLIFSVVALFIFFMWLGRIPIKLLAVVGIVAIIAIFYMIKSLLIRVKPEDPGRSLQESEAPMLWQLVRDVATTINTRPVNEIRLTQGTDLAVYERGSFREKMSDSAERILILGTGVLNGFDQNAFRAVLAHEYGHFSNRDTAGGDIAFRVNSDIMRAAESMVASDTATFYNVGFQFLRLFHFLFRRITHGATRLQEVLADRVAAYHFGADAFKEGLDHVVRRELEFNVVADTEINAALAAGRPVNNIYDLHVSDDAKIKEIDEAFAEIVNRPTTNDDTHPSPKDRYRYLEGIQPKTLEKLNGSVWDLFSDRNAVIAEMNSVVEAFIRPSYEQESSTLGI